MRRVGDGLDDGRRLRGRSGGMGAVQSKVIVNINRSVRLLRGGIGIQKNH